MESLQQRIHAEQAMANNSGGFMKKLTFVLADGAQTYTITTERNITITSGNAANTMTITLPPVNECAGEMIYIYAPTGATATTTVEDNDGDAGLTDISLDGDEFTLLYSTGEKWIEVATIGNS